MRLFVTMRYGVYPLPCNPLHSNDMPQALAVEPINPHLVELLNLAMESNGMESMVESADWETTIASVKQKWVRLGQNDPRAGSNMF